MMGKTYRVFTVKARPNDPRGVEETWEVLFKCAQLIEHKDRFESYPRLKLIEGGVNDEFSR
jgi:hypothetical protein